MTKSLSHRRYDCEESFTRKKNTEDVRMCPAVPVKKYSIKENFFSIVLAGIEPNYCGKKEKWMKNDPAQL